MNTASKAPSNTQEKLQKPIEGLRKDYSGYLPQSLPNALQTKAILKRHGIDLFALAGDGDRFVRLFQDTWKRIPLGARRRILKHWREVAPPCPLTCSPRIELSSNWAGREGTDTSGEMADTSMDGHSLKFFSRRVDLMPDNLVCDLIAHELAHVHQSALGISLTSRDDDGTLHFADKRGGYWSAGDLEEDADATMEGWGFDATAMDDWAVQQGFIEPKNITLEEAIALADEFDRTGRR